MKMILIAAAALMTGASVYGVVDYNKRSGNRDFENLYAKEKKASFPEAEKANLPAEGNDSKAVADDKAKVTTKGNAPVKKAVKKKRKVSYKEFSRAEPVEVIEEKELK